jgi:hypothetical protein
VSGLLQLDRSRRLDASYTIFSLICIELWCRMFVDPVAPAQVHRGGAPATASRVGVGGSLA